jgi:hypothetical protein
MLRYRTCWAYFLFVVMANDIHIAVAVSAIAGSCFSVLETLRLFLTVFYTRIQLGQIQFRIGIPYTDPGRPKWSPEKGAKMEKFQV